MNDLDTNIRITKQVVDQAHAMRRDHRGRDRSCRPLLLIQKMRTKISIQNRKQLRNSVVRQALILSQFLSEMLTASTKESRIWTSNVWKRLMLLQILRLYFMEEAVSRMISFWLHSPKVSVNSISEQNSLENIMMQ